MDRNSPMDKKYYLGSILILFFALYIYLYFNLPYFVFFNFDMPRQAFHVQDFLKTGTFLTAQYFSEESVWRNISWGPTGVFFYAFFLKISSDPLIVSYLLSILNIFSVVFVTAFTWRYISKNAAIVVGFLLATNPYWLTYARIIWVPNPMTFFIPLSMYLFFEAFYGKKWWAQTLLPVSWVALIQIYLATYSFVVTSFIASLFFYKSIKVKSLILGVVLSFVLLLPTIYFYTRETVYVDRIFEAPTLFTPKETRFSERLAHVVSSYVQIPVGGVFEHQTGYGYKDFVEDYLPIHPYATMFMSALFIASLIWNLYQGLVRKEYKRLILFFWAITPIWSMVVLWVSDILPRYYLLAFPAALLLIALFISDLIKLSKLCWILSIIVTVYWSLFSISYNSFVRDYDYLLGRFGDIAETPYVYLKNALGWVIKDAGGNGCSPVVTNNYKNLDFDMWLETKYIWQYIYNRQIEQKFVPNPCYYVVNYKPLLTTLEIGDHKTFGPFVVFRYSSKN